ncbi:hypothetical protein QJQ45_025031 [Haematococcus lacustris]|nr:hypothetical protein QJQ45_025031 [Haematococcus lacustris]
MPEARTRVVRLQQYMAAPSPCCGVERLLVRSGLSVYRFQLQHQLSDSSPPALHKAGTVKSRTMASRVLLLVLWATSAIAQTSAGGALPASASGQDDAPPSASDAATIPTPNRQQLLGALAILKRTAAIESNGGDVPQSGSAAAVPALQAHTPQAAATPSAAAPQAALSSSPLLTAAAAAATAAVTAPAAAAALSAGSATAAGASPPLDAAPVAASGAAPAATRTMAPAMAYTTPPPGGSLGVMPAPLLGLTRGAAPVPAAAPVASAAPVARSSTVAPRAAKPASVSSARDGGDNAPEADAASSNARVQAASQSYTYNGPRSACVCAMDFDLTLRIPEWKNNQWDYDSKAPEGQQVLAACQAVPCYIAIASANGNTAKLHKVLAQLYGDTLFSPAFLNSPAFQSGRGDKSTSLTAIMQYYNVDAQCVALFDDLESNRRYATRLGSYFNHVNSATGAAMWNYDRMVRSLPDACFIKGRPSGSQAGGSQPGRYYPSVPSYNLPPQSAFPPEPAYDPNQPAYNPAYAPSAPPMPTSPADYAPAQGQYGSAGMGGMTGMSDAEEEAALELAQLRDSAGTTKTLSFLGFWAQFALSIVSAGILLFSVGFVPRAPGMGTAVDISKYLTLGGVLTAFVSAMFAHGFLTLSRKLLAGGSVTKRYVVATLLTNNAICLAGIGITVIGLQASVGTLVAKSLATAISGPITYSQAGSALVSLDVFALQASTNTLLCHVIGLLFTNLMLRLVNRVDKRFVRATA